jgi:hypothetical protein
MAVMKGTQMPNARLIEKSEVQRASRRRAGEHVAKEREEARQWLRQAKETGRAIELVLGTNERDETIKARYRAVAREEQVKIRFQTASQRTYRNRKGKEEYEAEVMIVMVS